MLMLRPAGGAAVLLTVRVVPGGDGSVGDTPSVGGTGDVDGEGATSSAPGVGAAGDADGEGVTSDALVQGAAGDALTVTVP